MFVLQCSGSFIRVKPLSMLESSLFITNHVLYEVVHAYVIDTNTCTLMSYKV
jgi:hypothetical protein